MSREGRGERGNELSRVGNHEIRGVQKHKERNKEQCVGRGRGVGKQKGEVRKRWGGDGREMREKESKQERQYFLPIMTLSIEKYCFNVK